MADAAIVADEVSLGGVGEGGASKSLREQRVSMLFQIKHDSLLTRVGPSCQLRWEGCQRRTAIQSGQYRDILEDGFDCTLRKGSLGC